ncbi:uncharacterized protein LOC131615626 [Vicia villosa]|uniref:uncharacterized protein LOC131615626 n=1 Tax=Vicia villosa TaxID=3911 RepID=UPI00273B0DAA|nr:uncharacterized protein LOC131615626 [Vicia villosa]XP_058742759.1 uncharacterized protein LOC131615626 [Vicia villosa]
MHLRKHLILYSRQTLLLPHSSLFIFFTLSNSLNFKNQNPPKLFFSPNFGSKCVHQRSTHSNNFKTQFNRADQLDKLIRGRVAQHASVRRARMEVVSQVTDGSAVPVDVPNTSFPVEIPGTSVPTDVLDTSVSVDGPSTSTTSSRRPRDDGEDSSQTPSAHRRRRVTSSTLVPPPTDVGSSEPTPDGIDPLHEEADALVGYLGGPSNFPY